MIQTKLKGKAAITYNSLDNVEHYEFVKASILDAYAIAPDGYRQKFRTYYKSYSETSVEFAIEKPWKLWKCLHSTKTCSFGKLVNLTALKEFKEKFHLIYWCAWKTEERETLSEQLNGLINTLWLIKCVLPKKDLRTPKQSLLLTKPQDHKGVSRPKIARVPIVNKKSTSSLTVLTLSARRRFPSVVPITLTTPNQSYRTPLHAHVKIILVLQIRRNRRLKQPQSSLQSNSSAWHGGCPVHPL